MENLKHLLYKFVKQSELFFHTIQDHAVEGYIFWKKGHYQDGVLLDSKLSPKLAVETLPVIAKLKLSKKDFLESIIKQVENDSVIELKSGSIFQSFVNEPVNKTNLRYVISNDTVNGSNYVIAAIQETTYFIREQSISDISDILDVAVWQYNLFSGEVLINEMWAQLIGYTKSELYPVTVDTFKKLTHPVDFEEFQIVIQKYIAGESDNYSTEFRMRHKDGYWKWVLARGKTIARNEKGEIEWMMGSHIDITDRKAHETEIETLAQVPVKTLSSILITNPSGKIIFTNAAFEKLTGYRFEEMVNKKPGSFLQGPLTDKNDIISFRKHLATEKSFTQEILNYSKNGIPYTVSCYVDPVYNEKGEVTKYISIQRDITEEKRNKEFLATFKNTLDQTEDCVFIFDADTLKFTYVNQGAVNMMGYSEEELLHIHPFDIKPEYPEEKFRGLVASLKSENIASHRFQTVHRLKNGETIPVEIHLQFIHNEDVSAHFVAIVKDISEELEIEKKLKRLSLVAEKTNNLVVITDDKGKIEYVNAAFEAKSGYSLSELIGEKPGKFVYGKETNPEHIKANQAGLKKLKPFTQEILNYSKSGEQYWVSVTFNPIFNDREQLTNFIAIESDITERKVRENLLKESEQRLQFVLEGSELGYWDWDASTGTMMVNDRWFEMLGYKSSDFSPSIDKWHSLVHPDDMSKLNHIMETVFPDPNKSDFYVELRAKHKKGHYVWILDRGSVVERDSSGAPSRVSGMHMEISGRKRLEFDLEREKKFLDDIINTSALSLLVINRKGRIIYANSGAEKLLGLDKTVIEQKPHNDPIWDFYTMDGHPFPEEKLPYTQVMQTGEIIKDIQLSLIWKDGTIKYLSLSGAPMNYENGKVHEVVITFIDITKRIVAQKELDQTKNQMQSILKEMSDVVYSVSLPDYRMFYITPSIENITGFPTSYYLNRKVSDTWEASIYDADKPLVEKAYQDLSEKGTFESEYRIRTKEGSIQWVLIKGKIIYSNDKAIRLDGYIADISSRKEQENSISKYLSIVEDQNERLRNFTYIVSHNLRSHSANIQGLMYLINKKNPEIASHEYVKLLGKASGKLDDTLHHLNNVVSVVSSTQEMNKVNLSDAITSFIDAFYNVISSSKVYILNEVSKNVVVEAVPAFLESIITNLLTNSIKYRDEKKPESYVKITVRNFNGIVVLEVIDNGIGIDLEKYGEKLFGMYKTFHNHKDSRGLGLFITKNQVESMGGKIEVESKLGEGSTFKVFLKDGNF